MPKPHFQCTKMLIEYSFWRRCVNTRANKVTCQSRQRIVAGIVFIGGGMCFISTKIFYRRLGVKTVEWSNREKGRYLHWKLQFRRMCFQAPVVYVVPVITPDNNFITQKIV